MSYVDGFITKTKHFLIWLPSSPPQNIPLVSTNISKMTCYPHATPLNFGCYLIYAQERKKDKSRNIDIYYNLWVYFWASILSFTSLCLFEDKNFIFNSGNIQILINMLFHSLAFEKFGYFYLILIDWFKLSVIKHIHQ